MPSREYSKLKQEEVSSHTSSEIQPDDDVESQPRKEGMRAHPDDARPLATHPRY